MWPGWVSVPNEKSKPGAPLTYLSATGLLFGTDPGGGVIYAYGSPTTNWNTGWQSVSQGGTLPGSPITAVPFGTAGDIGVFLTDPNGKRPVLLSITHNLRTKDEAQLDVGQACKPSPHDDIAWRRIFGSGKISSESGEFGQVEGEHRRRGCVPGGPLRSIDRVDTSRLR